MDGGAEGDGEHLSGILAVLDPPDARVATEPRPLAPGKAPGGAHGILHALLEGHPMLDMGQQLAVAERLAGRSGDPKRPLGERPHLFDQTVSHPRLEPLCDAPVDHCRD